MKRRDHRRGMAAVLLWAATGAATALAAPGNLQWTTTVGHVDENAGVLQMVVERIGGSDGVVGIDYATFNLEAIAGSDYETVSGTLSWGDGEGGARTVEIPILDDATPELEERLGALLSNPTGGTLIVGSAQFLGIVHDDDGPPPGGRLRWNSNVTDDEGAGVFVFTVERVEASAGAVSVDYGSVNLEAIAGEDYDSVSGTLTWADGESDARTIEVPVLDDAVVELQERFAVILDNAVGDVQVQGSMQALGIVDDNDGAPTGGRLRWGSQSVDVAEDVDVVVLTVERVEASSGAVSVAYTSFNLEAVENDDYLPVSGTLHWADGETAAQTIEVVIVDDDIIEMPERLAMLLGDTTGDVQITGSTQATVYIQDDDAGSTGLLRFEQATHSVDEDAGSLQLTVLREGGSAGEIGVSYASGGGDASVDADYDGISGILNWVDGDATPRVIVVPVLDDTAQEPDETFDVTLSLPTGGAALGSPSFTRVTIVDDGDLPPPAGTLAFDPHIYPVLEDDGLVQLIVTRSGGDVGAVSVDYATVAMSADAGADFVAASGTLAWPAGDDDPRFISVNLLDDAVPEPTETFRIELSAPTGEAVLGAQSSAFVQVADDDEETPDALFRDGFE